MKICVAEDDFLIRMVLEEYLTDLGHAVITAEDGQAALDLLRVAPFDVLVTDISMPRMTGVQLLDVVGVEFPHLFCIVASGLGNHVVMQELARVKARILGMAPKPATFAHLGRLLAEAERHLALDPAA
jgi:CheY-like chemotaxis protein